MKRTLYLLFFSILFSTSTALYAQTQNVKEVQAVIEQLFDGMRESDSTKVSASFTKDAVMQTIGKNQAGEVMINSGNLAGFLRAVGTPKNEVWDERIQSYDINIDGNLATVWTPYQFYQGEEFSHCGVNSFQLAHTSDGWKIFHIVDTRRKDNCVES